MLFPSPFVCSLYYPCVQEPFIGDCPIRRTFGSWIVDLFSDDLQMAGVSFLRNNE